MNKGKRKILVFSSKYINHPDAGGADEYLSKVLEQLTDQYEIKVLTSHAYGLPHNEVVRGVEIVRRGNIFSIYLLAPLLYLTKYRHWAHFVIDVFTGSPFYSPIYSRKPKITLLYHLGGKQFFGEFNNLVFALVGFLLERYLAPIVYRRSSIITISASTRDEMGCYGFDTDRIDIAPVGVTDRIADHIEKDEKTVLVISRLKAHKRIELSIRLVSDLKQRGVSVRLVIAGKGKHKAVLEGLVGDLGVGDQVEFVGFVSELKKHELMHKAAIFLMTSDKEGFGLTVIEAGVQETPTVGFNVYGVRDAIVDKETGVLVDSYDQFVDTVAWLLRDQQTRVRYGRRAREFALTFNWQNTADVFKRNIKQLLLDGG